MNMNQVTLPALNIVESVAFYRKLGLKQIVNSEHYARFECPDGAGENRKNPPWRIDR